MFCILTSCTFIKTSKGFHLVVINIRIDLITSPVHHVHQIFVNRKKPVPPTLPNLCIHTLNVALSFALHNK